MLNGGTMLGPYEIQSALGAGGMGDVYRARDTKLGRDVAIRIIPEAFAGDSERIADIEREARLLAALNHRNIAGIYGLEQVEDTRFLVLELVEGESLATRLARDGALLVDEALAIARRLIDAVEAAHGKGILHRDLKPANIMITPDGDVKVLGFGVARAVEPASTDLLPSPAVTVAGTLAESIPGTAAYTSPERAKGRPADKRCDIWAFGCVLYEMLAGKRAFEGDTLAAVLRADPDWKALPDGLTPNLVTVLKGCLEKDRRGRIADIAVARFVMTRPVDAAAAASAARAAQLRPLFTFIAGLLIGVTLAALALLVILR